MKLINLEKNIEKYKLLELISLLMICWAVYQLFLNVDLLSGDAEIHLIYAKNFVNGHFLEFNPGYKTGGESSFLYFLIVSLIYKFFGFYTYYGMKLISLLSFLWILYQIYLVNPSESISIKLIGASILSVIGLMSSQAMLGMENIFFAAILITFLSEEIRSGIRYENKRVILKSALLFLLRPEGLAYPLFLSIKSFFYKNKNLLISSILSIIFCGILYLILSLISGGNYHNAGSIRRYISSLPIYAINNFNLNLLGYQFSISLSIFRNLIYVYPLIIGILIFKKYLGRIDLLISIVFIVLPLFLHLFNFIPTVQFTRYFIYSYCIIFLIFAARIIPNLSKSFIALLAIIYLTGSAYAGIAHNHKFLKCTGSEEICSSKIKFREYLKSTSPENVKKYSDELFKKLAINDNDVINIGTIEVQIRNKLDNRFMIWSLDGIVDRELNKFKGKDYIDHFQYIDFRDIDYLADLPNLNKRSDLNSLNDFSKSLNKSTPTFCTNPANVFTVRREECFLKTREEFSSKCINNIKLKKTNVKSWYLNLGGWNGGWLWKVEKCN